ncbi:ELWxxDGT repeat protein [Dyadobacter sp. LHD-138]|uniref:ELWxxDGT repeat protein n=1 Tax=Dyadobacter sp. LHD-138 TaxID=3071413 RepID=UPI0027E1D8C9|nr:ELWxxDGT repeat protein [Dyadobacter sp. LHD-138]MDQ6481909.1 hypothetical protein [Dyadobacter sp. LHD-138]
MRKFPERHALFCLIGLFVFSILVVDAQVLVKDIKPLRASSNPEQLTNANGLLYFVADDGVHGKELWKSDGTAEGTVMVKDIIPGAGDGFIRNLLHVGGKLFFAASNPQIVNKLGGGETKLWKTDGTTAGTVELKDGINNPLESLKPANLTPVNGALFYTNTLAVGGQSNSGLFTSDGTDYPGTQLFGTFVQPSSQNNPLDSNIPYEPSAKATGAIAPSNFVNIKGTLYFVFAGYLWKSNGTAAGTRRISQTLEPGYLTHVNGVLYFVNSGKSVYATNPSLNTAYAVFKTSGPIANLIHVNGKLFYTQNRLRVTGNELYKFVLPKGKKVIFPL